jgi:hypothetical protein
MTTSYVAMQAVYIQDVGAITKIAELGSCNISMSGKTWQIEGRNDVAFMKRSQRKRRLDTIGDDESRRECTSE